MVVVRAAEVRGKQTSYRGFLVVVTPALLLVFHPLSSLASVTRTEAHLHRPTRVMVIIPLMCSADHTAETPKFFAAQTEDEGGREDNTYNISRVCKWEESANLGVNPLAGKETLLEAQSQELLGLGPGQGEVCL